MIKEQIETDSTARLNICDIRVIRGQSTFEAPARVSTYTSEFSGCAKYNNTEATCEIAIAAVIRKQIATARYSVGTVVRIASQKPIVGINATADATMLNVMYW